MEHSDVSLPADSLFSALCVTLGESWRRGGGGTAGAVPTAETRAAAPFRLTSLMPYAAEVYFLPYPMIGPPKVTGADDLRRRKRFKEIAWVSEAVFRWLACGESPTDAVATNGRRSRSRAARSG